MDDRSAAMQANMRVLLGLAWPIVLARATQAVVGFADALMVAPLGSETLAAVTTGGLDTFAFVMLPMGTVFIVQSFAAQLQGKGDGFAARRYAFYGLIIAAVAGVVGALAIPFTAALLRPLGYAPFVHATMSDYVAVRLLSVAAVVGAEALGNWYGGLGNTRLAMVAGVCTMLCNVAGNYLLIEPRFGLPGYGAVGAAAASVIASWLGFAVAAFAFARGIGCEQTLSSARTGDGARAHPLRQLEWAELGRVLRFGLPNGLNWFLEFAAFAFFINVVVGSLGTSVLAAMNVVLQINTLSFMPAFGIASAGAILVGNAIGSQRRDQVAAIVGRTLALTCLWMGSVGVLYWVAPGSLIGLFRPADASAQSLLEAGVVMLALSAFWQLFDAAGMTLSEALRSAGDTTFCMSARLILAWLVFAPGAFVSVRVLDGGIVAVMLSLMGYLGLLACALGLRFASGRWRDIDLLGTGLPQL